MTEPTITCPNCKTEIKLTESLAAPLIEATRKEFEKRLSQKDADIVKRESTVREKEEALSKAKEAIDEQIARVMQATVVCMVISRELPERHFRRLKDWI